MTARKKLSHRTDAVPVVPAELSPSPIPAGLGTVLMWCLGTAAVVTAIWVAVINIRDHNTAVEEKHDAQFVKKDDAAKASAEVKAAMDKHERDDVTAIKQLAESTNAAIVKLTDAVNQQSVTAEVSRQWTRSSNLEVKALVLKQIAKECQKDAAKNPLACQDEIRAASDAVSDAKKQGEAASARTNESQALRIAPPTIIGGEERK